VNGAKWTRAAGLTAAAGLGLAAAAVTGFVLGPRTLVPDGGGADIAVAVAPLDAGPDAAARMVDRIVLFRDGHAASRIELSSQDLTALLRHAAPGLVPEGVLDPEVLLAGSDVRLRARVAPARLPGGELLGSALAAMGDEVDVELRGRLVRLTPDRMGYRIDRAAVEGVPLPRAVVVRLVQGWPGGGVEDATEDPRAIVAVRWPLGDARIRVRDGILELERAEPILSEAVDGSDGA
jgi:hypothetical protein